MELPTAILVACFLLLVASYMKLRKKNLPPGPYGLPLLGYQPFLGKEPIKVMNRLKKKYGNVVRIRLGTKNVVILNDWQAIKEALVKQGAIFSGRMNLFWQRKIFSGKGIIMSDGIIWKEQRYRSVQILRDFGFGRSSLESMIMYEVDSLTDYLNSNAGKPIIITKLFTLTILNIIWNMVSGHRFDETDEFVPNFKEFIRNLTSPGTYNVVNSFPSLRFLHPRWKQEYQRFMTGTKKLQDFLNEEVTNHETNFQEHNLRDFIDVYLAEIYKHNEQNGKDVPPYDRNHLMGTIMDLLLAGHATTEMTMCWALLHMANRPDIQRKVQQELDSVMANDSFLSISSKALAPYTEATLLEIQRTPTLLPLSVPHRVIRDATLLGYTIPKGTMVYPNIYAVHHDKQYWGDPEMFRPERFLDETGTKVIRHECFMPFSVGPRACMGDTMARLDLHLLFTCLMRRFTFEMIPGEPKPSLEPIPGALFKTQPFSLIVKPR